MRNTYTTGFLVDDPDEFLWNVKSRVSAMLEEPSMPLGDDLSPDDYTIESLTFDRRDERAKVEVEISVHDDHHPDDA